MVRMWSGMGSGVMESIEGIWNNKWAIRFLHGRHSKCIVGIFKQTTCAREARNARLFPCFY